MPKHVEVCCSCYMWLNGLTASYIANVAQSFKQPIKQTNNKTNIVNVTVTLPIVSAENQNGLD